MNMKCTRCKKEIESMGGINVESENLDFLGLSGDALLCNECSKDIVEEAIKISIQLKEKIEDVRADYLKLSNVYMETTNSIRRCRQNLDTNNTQYEFLLGEYEKLQKKYADLLKKVEGKKKYAT